MEELKEIAKGAGDILLRYRNRELAIRTKADESDFVTEADTESDAFIRTQLTKLFPEDQILSEETIDTVEDFSGRVWIVDPLDATDAYIRGNNGFSVMIGLSIHGKSSLGLIYLPALDTYYWASEGGGAWKQIGQQEPEPLHVNEVTSLEKIRFAVPSGGSVPIPATEYVHAASGGLKAGLLAEGKVEGIFYTDSNTGKWDFCASDILVREAGGQFTDAIGMPVDYSLPPVIFPKCILASNAHIHELMKSVV
jgi:fructose-1,6-bisphosphatase/inositol monophosphatase family enzyme